MRQLAGLLVLDCGYLAVGTILLRRLGFVTSSRSALRYAGVSFMAGWALVGILSCVLLMLGGALGGWRLVLLFVAAGVLAAAPSFLRVEPAQLGREPVSPRFRPAGLAFAALLAVYGLALLAQALVSGADVNWDSWAFWQPKAQAIFYFGGLDTAPGGFTSFANPEYPPLAPAAEAAAFHAVGEVDRLALPFQHWVLAAAFFGAAAALLARRAPAALLWPFLAMLALVPTLDRYLLSSLADLQVAFLVALAGLCGALWLIERRVAYIVVANLLLTAATLTKTEGFLLAMTVPVALAVAEPRTAYRHWRALATLAASPTAALVMWKVWLAAHDQPLSSTLYDVGAVLHPLGLLERHDRLTFALAELVGMLFSPSSWLLVAPSFVVAALIAWAATRRSLGVYAGAWCLIAFAGLSSVYWIASVDVEWYVDTSAERVLLSVGIFMGTLAPLLAAESMRRPGAAPVSAAVVPVVAAPQAWPLQLHLRRFVASVRANSCSLAVLTTIAVVFLAPRLGLLWRFPPFSDEALYASWALQVAESPDSLFVSLTGGKEPLLPWLAAPLIEIGVEPLTAARLISILSGLATLVFTGLIAAQFGGRWAAAAAAFLCAVLPFFVVHDVIGIYDPLATALSTAALYFLIRLSRSGGWRWSLALGAALGAGLLTKQTTYIAVALLPLGLLLPQARMRITQDLFAWVLRVALAAAIAVGLYSILLFSEHYADLARVRTLVYPTHSLTEALTSPGLWLERNWPFHRAALATYVSLPVILLAAVGAGVALRRMPRLGVVVLAWSIAPIVAAVLIADVAYPRYILAGIPPLIAFAGYASTLLLGLVRPPSRVSPRAVVAGIAALLALMPALAFDARVLRDPEATRYPSRDDEQYVTSWAAGAPYEPLARDLREMHGRERTTVLMGERGSDALALLLRRENDLDVVREPDGTTRWGVANGVPLAEPPGAVTWRAIARYPRPRGGTVLVLHERGVPTKRGFARSPDELREQLGLTDRGFDVYLADNPEVRQWYLDWYDVRN